MIETLAAPRRSVAVLVTKLVPVSDLFTFVKIRPDAFLEHLLLAGLGVEAFDDPDAAERLGQPAGDLRVDGASLAEDRPYVRERGERDRPEENEGNQGDQRHVAVDADQEDEGDDGRDDPSGELDEPRADQVPDTLDVPHDAGDELAGLHVDRSS